MTPPLRNILLLAVALLGAVGCGEQVDRVSQEQIAINQLEGRVSELQGQVDDLKRGQLLHEKAFEKQFARDNEQEDLLARCYAATQQIWDKVRPAVEAKGGE